MTSFGACFSWGGGARPPATPPLVILGLLAGCQQIDLAEEWELDRLRLLAIRADPAEPAPGDAVTFTSLAFVPGGAEWSAVWFGCVAGSEEGCSFDPALLEGLEDLESMTPEEQAELFAALQAAGLLGVEPALPPTWTVPADALDGLTDAEALEGVSATLQVTLATEDDTELVVKRLPVSRASTPNTNPDVLALGWDGETLASGETRTVEAGGAYELGAAVAALEEYEYVTTDGVTEQRTEELEWRWYATGGQLGGGFGPELGGAEDPLSTSVTWIAPEEAGSHTIHAVVLDGRGGMGWATLFVNVE